MKAQLVPLDGTAPIEIVKDMTLIGRSKKLCDVCFDKRSVSKTHCALVKTDGLLFVRDLGSTNGTKVNGQRVRRAALLPGDQLSVGGEKFRVHLGPTSGVAPENAPTEMMTMIKDHATEAMAPPQRRKPLDDPDEPFAPAADSPASRSPAAAEAENAESSIIPLIDDEDDED